MRSTFLLLAVVGCVPVVGPTPSGTGSSVCTAPTTGATSVGTTSGTIVPTAGCGVLEAVQVLASTGHEIATHVVAYPDGGLAQAGYFRESLVVDAGGPAEAILTAYGSDNDGLLVRYCAAGEVLWVRQLGNAKVRDIAPAPDGGLFVAGWFSDTARIALGEPDELVVVSAGTNDGFVARFDPTGALSWFAHVAGTGWQLADTVDVVDEDVLVSGHFEVDATLGTVGLTAVPGTELNGFVARLSGADATVLWAESFGGATDIAPAQAAYDPVATELVLAGEVVGPGEVLLPGGEVLDPDGGRNWMARWSTLGGATWAVTTEASANGLWVRADGALLVAGGFSGEVVLGAGEPNETTLQTDLTSEAYLASFAPDHTLSWAVQSSSTSGTAYALALAGTGDGGAVMTGRSGVLTTFDGAGIADDGVFLARFDPAGAVVCTATIDSYDAGAVSITEQRPGLFAATGYFNEHEATFAPGTDQEKLVPNVGEGDMFLGFWSF